MKYKPFNEVKQLNVFLRERADFSLKNFGTPQQHTFKHCLTKLKGEVEELLENPEDEGEWADCLLLLLDAAFRYGYSFEDLVGFANKKLAINKKRKWKRLSNGVYQHV